MKKIVSLVLVSILCVSLFAGCGDESPATTREMPKVVDTNGNGRHFDVSVEEFKEQFNETKVSGVEPLEASKIDIQQSNQHNSLNCFDVQENIQLSIVSEPDGSSISEARVMLVNKDDRSNKELKTFRKYIDSLIRWVNPKATSKDIKTYYEKLSMEDNNPNQVVYNDPITGFTFLYTVIDKNLGFAINAKG